MVENGPAAALTGRTSFEEVVTLHRRLSDAVVAGAEPSADAVAQLFRVASSAASTLGSAEQRDELQYIVNLWESHLGSRGASIPDINSRQPDHQYAEVSHTPTKGVSDAEHLFVNHLAWIDRIAAVTHRRHGLEGTEAEDFAAWVKMKMMEDDYAVLRKFHYESDIRTYITSLVVRYFHAYRRQALGRWRPSAVAVRLGPPAPELERLVHRDGYSLAQAGEKLRTAGVTTLNDAELGRLLGRIPQRVPLRPRETTDALLIGAESPLRAEARVAASEAESEHSQLMAALERAMEQLSPEERVIVTLHFRDGRPIADVARVLGLEQKPLYRLLPRLRQRLRDYLEREGVSAPGVRAALLNTPE